MRRHDGPVSDEMVDAYRAVISVREAAAAITPGAGVDPNKVIRPSKRMKNWHRSADVGCSLKDYARRLATTSGDNKAVAIAWLDSKAGRP